MRTMACYVLVIAWSNGALGQEAIKEPESPLQFDEPQIGPALVEVDAFIRASEAKARFQVTGQGLTVAVIDSGLRVTHQDFSGRVIARHNVSSVGDSSNVEDVNGHGTNVTGIIAARRANGVGVHRGIAEGANIIPIKLFPGGEWPRLIQALTWVRDHQDDHSITVVNMSLGNSANLASDEGITGGDLAAVRTIMQDLRSMRIAVVVSAGNDFFPNNSKQGMSLPGVFRESISVGAVYDSDIEPPAGQNSLFHYSSGAICFRARQGLPTPFSQRLHETVGGEFRTDIFAPGAPVTSSGATSDTGESVQHGTSQAAPVIAGVVLLLQERYRFLTSQIPGTPSGILPTVDQLETWLRSGSVKFNDSEDAGTGVQLDNVTNTKLDFLRVDAVRALEELDRQFQAELVQVQAASLRKQLPPAALEQSGEDLPLLDVFEERRK